VLVRVDDEGALAIGQLSHSWLSGQLARAWGNDRFGGFEPREEVILGAEQHDVGWASVDLAPQFNPETGLPRSFLQMTVRDHLAIWRGAPNCVLSQSACAALVVSMHGASLSELRARLRPDEAHLVRGHIEEERTRQVELRSLLGISEAQAERIRRLVWTWDGLSLALCNGWRPFTAQDVPTAGAELVPLGLGDLDDGRVTLDPWPFAADRVEVRCEARRLAARYEDEDALRRAFEAAPPVTLRFALAAP
jgi:hypothetical protein